MEDSSLAVLQKYMSTIPPGDIVDTARIEDLLAAAWDQLQGDCGGMQGYKLRGRMEDVQWSPPILSFVIERHGGTVLGSGYAELQSWAVDVNSGRATLDDRPRKRWVGGPRNSPLKVAPIAAEIAELIKSGKSDPRLKWKSADEVRILIGEVIPADCPNQTLVGRRMRFKKALQEALDGWELTTYTNTAKRVS